MQNPVKTQSHFNILLFIGCHIKLCNSDEKFFLNTKKPCYNIGKGIHLLYWAEYKMTNSFPTAVS